MVTGNIGLYIVVTRFKKGRLVLGRPGVFRLGTKSTNAGDHVYMVRLGYRVSSDRKINSVRKDQRFSGTRVDLGTAGES